MKKKQNKNTENNCLLWKWQKMNNNRPELWNKWWKIMKNNEKWLKINWHVRYRTYDKTYGIVGIQFLRHSMALHIVGLIRYRILISYTMSYVRIKDIQYRIWYRLRWLLHLIQSTGHTDPSRCWRFKVAASMLLDCWSRVLGISWALSTEIFRGITLQ
jgi:hypothetical protein